MTDKEYIDKAFDFIVEQLRAEIERLKKENNGSPLSVCNDLLSFIDSLQEEPKPKFKVGDTLKKKGKDYTFIVDRIQGGFYHCDHGHGAFFPIEEQNKWELLEETVSDDLKKFAEEWDESLYRSDAVIAGAKWHKQQMIKSAKLSGWIARDEDDRLHLFEVEPRRLEKEHRWWDRDYHSTGLDENDFPDLKWEDEPVYVKLVIIKEE